MAYEGSAQLTQIWTALRGSEDDLAAVAPSERDEHGLPAALWDLVHGSIAAASLQAALLAGGTPHVELETARILTAVTSERHFRIDGEPPQIWAELSGFWRTADGWVRTHANYPHHRERLLRLLGLDDGVDVSRFAAAVADRPSVDLEEGAAREGAVVFSVRTAENWAVHPVGAAVSAEPLVEVLGAGEGKPRPDRFGGAVAPLAGTRVLDLTRVIAGPVATRTLALLGADVLRIDSPDRPEPEWQHLDTGQGKRSALLRLTDGDVLASLIESADVVVLGYRPGSLDRFGLGPDALAARRPDLVVAQIDAWGWTTPWADRRGFDSVVQAASGIANASSPDGDRPGALPFQALDHSAGYLLAAGVLRALGARSADGHGARVRVSLARLAHELLASGFTGPAATAPFAPTLGTTPTPVGEVTTPLPALSYWGGTDRWPASSRPWGTDPARWATPLR